MPPTEDPQGGGSEQRLPDRPREPARLTPRWSVWFRESLSLAAAIVLMVLVLLITQRGPGVVFPLIGFIAFRLSKILFEICWERRTRPPAPRYWRESNRYRLTVRETRSGRVLIRSHDSSLADAELAAVPLEGACLCGLDLEFADLSLRDLRGADLRRANLRGTSLTGACLKGANLEGAVLAGTDLRGADLKHARLGNAVLSNTDLRNADLRGADLVGRGATQRLWDTDLGGAHFRGALYDSGTHWPRGFDYTARGCVRGPEDSGSLPIPAEADAPDFDVLPRPSGGA